MAKPMTVAARGRRRQASVALVALLALVWIMVTWERPRPRPVVVDSIQVLDNSRSGVLLVGWEADRCERLRASSTARVQETRLVLDLVAVQDDNCMAQQPVGSTDPVRRWRMLEAIVVEGSLGDLGPDREAIQLACERDDATGCGAAVSWRS